MEGVFLACSTPEYSIRSTRSRSLLFFFVPTRPTPLCESSALNWQEYCNSVGPHGTHIHPTYNACYPLRTTGHPFVPGKRRQQARIFFFFLPDPFCVLEGKTNRQHGGRPSAVTVSADVGCRASEPNAHIITHYCTVSVSVHMTRPRPM